MARASMGPRSHERGNTGAPSVDTPPHALQWGRVLMNAETGIDGWVREHYFWLQWGRVLMNAETTPGSQRASRPARCFNGAAFS